MKSKAVQKPGSGPALPDELPDALPLAALVALAAVAAKARARWSPAPPVFPAAWAVAYGEDRHGLWQAFEVKGVRQVMRWLPPGQFTMGTPLTEPEREEGEKEHAVTLTEGCWLAETCCTQALWLAVTGTESPSRFSDQRGNPVDSVSWNDIVQDFLPRLNALVPGLQARLPTEALWEYACRADASSPTAFSFGPQINSDQVNFDGNHPLTGGKKSAYRERTVPVKSLPCNRWGLFEMHGNVWEWCADWYAPYPLTAVTNPMGPSEAPTEAAGRVLRGGSWVSRARGCRSGMRGADVPGLRYGIIGFRLARGAS